MRKHFLQPHGESLCQLFWLLQIGRIRLPQQCHKAVWGSKYSQYIVIYCHLVSWLHHLAHLLCHFLIFCVLSCNFIATFCTHTVPRIHLNKGIRHIKILHHHSHFLQNFSIFSPFYDWHCSKFLRCTEFWSGIEEKGISDLQFSAWIVVTIKLLTLTNFPSLWHSFFLNMS